MSRLPYNVSHLLENAMTAATHAASLPAAPEAAAAAPMRAMLQSAYGGLEVYRAGTVDRPRLAAGEVLVQVHAAGFDRGTWHMMTGRPYLMRLMGFGFRAPKNPVPGLEVAGTVVEVGAGVSRFKVGDAVFGVARGAFAEYAAALETKLALKPPSLGFEEAAALAVSGSTALQAIDAAKVGPGAKVLVIGASGGVGSFAVQLAKALGAQVTGVSSGGKVDFVRSLGADRALDYAREDFTDGSVRYDAILDTGGNTPLSRLRRALAPQGTLVFVGGEQGGDWSAGFERQLAAMLLAPFVKQKFVMLMNKEHFAPLERLAALAEAGQVKPAIDRAFPLERMPDAMRELVAGTVRGKLVLRVR